MTTVRPVAKLVVPNQTMIHPFLVGAKEAGIDLCGIPVLVNPDQVFAFYQESHDA